MILAMLFVFFGQDLMNLYSRRANILNITDTYARLLRYTVRPFEKNSTE